MRGALKMTLGRGRREARVASPGTRTYIQTVSLVLFCFKTKLGKGRGVGERISVNCFSDFFFT